MNEQNYQIGRIGFTYHTGSVLIPDTGITEKFRVDTFSDVEKLVIYEGADCEFEEKKYKPFAEANGTCIRYGFGKETEMIYHWAHQQYALGYFPSDYRKLKTEDRMRIRFRINPKLSGEVPAMKGIHMMEYLGMHAAFLYSGYLVLHASCILQNGRAILFTAPSGTGKSTQAGLWNRHEGARIINGDRALIGCENGIWYAYGYPECGSSGISENVRAPIAAIVVLEQAPENSIEAMQPGAKARALVSATKIWIWSLEQVELAMETAVKITAGVPIVKLKCTPDERAVCALKEYLGI